MISYQPLPIPIIGIGIGYIGIADYRSNPIAGQRLEEGAGGAHDQQDVCNQDLEEKVCGVTMAVIADVPSQHLKEVAGRAHGQQDVHGQAREEEHG